MCVVDAEKQNDMKKSQVKMLLFTFCEINCIFSCKKLHQKWDKKLYPCKESFGLKNMKDNVSKCIEMLRKKTVVNLIFMSGRKICNSFLC